jgi:hypothetical protein
MNQNQSIDIRRTSPQLSKPWFPAEILELIWEYAIEYIPPRIIEIKTSERPWLPWWSSAPIPALLHTCSRSRFLAQKHYEPSFPYNGRQPGRSRFTRILFNFEKDILYFSGESICLLEYRDEMKDKQRMRVRNVAFGPPLQEQDDEYLYRGKVLMVGRCWFFCLGWRDWDYRPREELYKGIWRWA